MLKEGSLAMRIVSEKVVAVTACSILGALDILPWMPRAKAGGAPGFVVGSRRAALRLRY